MYHVRRREEKALFKKSVPGERGVSAFVFLFGTHGGKLVLQNLIFLLTCLPVITIPAALAASNRISLELLRDGYCYLWEDYLKEFRRCFKKSFAVGVSTLLPLIACLAGAYMAPCLFGAGAGTAYAVALTIAGAVFYLSACYAFPMLALVELSAKKIIKNAFSMIAICKKNTLLLLVTGIIAYLHFFFLPYSIPFLLFLSFAVLQLVICLIVIGPFEEYIIL